MQALSEGSLFLPFRLYIVVLTIIYILKGYDMNKKLRAVLCWVFAFVVSCIVSAIMVKMIVAFYPWIATAAGILTGLLLLRYIVNKLGYDL